MSASGLTIKHLVFTGPQVAPAQLRFDAGLNLLYGASNTGKSFTVKAIDFMLGGTKDLPEFPERDGYDKLWLGFSLEGVGDFTLSRSTSGGSYELHTDLVSSLVLGEKTQTLAPTLQTKSAKSLPQFLLEQLGFDGKKLAKNADGVTEAISFRDIAAISLVDETSIQSERSPIESGQVVSRTRERSVFRLFLTGLDDSAITPVVDEKMFNTSKAVRIEVVEEMLKAVKEKLSAYPDIDDLPSQHERLSATLEKMQSEFDVVQVSIRKLVDEKQSLSTHIPQAGQRIEEIKVHLERFTQLEDVYRSDIDRLSALEEAGFLLSLGGEKACALCGAPTEAQKHTQDIENIGQIQEAALVEIAKIESQRKDLKAAIDDLQHEAKKLETDYPLLGQRLDEVEQEINRLAPRVNENRQTIREVIEARDHTKNGLTLLEQRNSYLAKLDEFNQLRKPSKDDKPNLKTPDSIAHQLCNIISDVLKAWEFPGNCLVSFDEKTYDLMIDGKLRINNGKGVRAVTHAAFKVALLMFCREKGLPHPGFVVLDTPLLTYRDPMKNPKAGDLTPEETVIAKSSLKQKFFEHLSSIKHLGQIIVLENVDPPIGIEKIASVQTFYGNTGSGRNGLFPQQAQ